MPNRINELHYITSINNIPSIMRYGILSYEKASKLDHESVAMTEIQERRDGVRIPGGLNLHQYANLYFNARNPMMFKRHAQAESLCVLKVSKEVFKIPNVVLADQNASTDYVRFFSVDQIKEINLDWVYVDDWRHLGDPITFRKHRAIMCAEVLVPYKIPTDYIIGAYVVNLEAESKIFSYGFTLPTEVNPFIFFQGSRP